jgi:hypothetical protein
MTTAFASGEIITAAKLNAVVSQFVGYGERTTTSTSSSSTTEVGVLRVSNVDLIGGRTYWIGYSCHPDSATATDVVRTTVRYATAGDATTASTILYKSRWYQAISPRHLMVGFVAPADGTYSFLLCLARNSGATACTLFCDADRGTELFIANVGVIADTGTDV